MSDLRNDAPANVPGMSHRKGDKPSDLGYPSEMQAHLSDGEASRLLREEKPEKVQAFIDALGLQQPVSIELATSFLEGLFKDMIPMDADAVMTQLRQDRWQQYVSPSDNLEEVAERIFRFLDTEEGLELGNFYTKILARRTDSFY